MNLYLIGISHKTAPVAVREKLAIKTAHIGNRCQAYLAEAKAGELAIISTCNRTEFYYYGTNDCYENLLQNIRHQIYDDSAKNNSEYLYLRQNEEATKHLYRVTSGMDSMVLGETEILGQIKEAYRRSHAAGTTSRALNPLFQSSFRVAKKIRNQTEIQRGATSVAAVSTRLAEQIFGNLETCTALVVGAGETGQLVLRSLIAKGTKKYYITSRKEERAKEIAEKFSAKKIEYETWPKLLKEVDILITATSAPYFLTNRAMLEQVGFNPNIHSLLAIDLAMPRDIDPDFRSLDSVYLYDIDQLQGIAMQGRKVREDQLAECEMIVVAEAKKFEGVLVSIGTNCRNEVPTDISTPAKPLPKAA